MAQSTRNRTKEFRERCSRRGVHRFIVRDGSGAICYVYECVDYEPAYRRTLELFQRTAALLMAGYGHLLKQLASSYRYEFRSAP
jgi:hypothetical protein